MSYQLERLKAIPIREVARAVGLEVRSETANARCFNHTAHPNGDRNPSLGLNNKTNLFKCFSCNIHGDAIELVGQTQGLDFKESCEWLATQFGIGKSTNNSSIYSRLAKIKRVIYKDPPPKPATSKDVEIYSRFYELTDPLTNEERRFLKDKGFTTQTIERFKWRNISDAAVKKLKSEFPIEELEDSGLFKQGKFMFYYHRLLVPFWQDGRLVYLRARTLSNAAGAKFVNVLGKDTQIFNYDALYEIPTTGSLHIAEGETDTMTLAQDGLPTIGIMGATQDRTVRQIADLLGGGFGDAIKVVLAFDNDKAGQEATKKHAHALFKKGIRAEIMQIPAEFKDVNDYYTGKTWKNVEIKGELNG